MMEGFDHYTRQGAAGSVYDLVLKGWHGSPFGFVNGRFPYGSQSGAIMVIFANPVMKPLPAPTSDLVFGFAFQVTQRLFNTSICRLTNESWTGQMTLGVTNTGLMTMSDGTSTTYGSHSISPSTWNYVECKLSGGVAEMHLNETADIAMGSGSYTQPWYEVSFEVGLLIGGGGDLYVDDFYMNDLTGPVNNDFLGDTVVETLYPINDGTYRDWTPDTGSAHFSRVNEHKIDKLTSYVHSVTPGNQDSYNIGDPVLAQTPVYAIQQNLGMLKTDTGTRVVQPLVIQGGTTYYGPGQSIPSDWEFVSWLQNQDPTGADWTYTTVNTDEYGIKLVS